ncbi:MAG TPA: sigma-70 family RNA polymerase sigma factor [Solirubrobacterales bacterium]|nr:sigma-70 family RNA polymerase sigma factor [Solirubrobacterales bacterium]
MTAEVDAVVTATFREERSAVLAALIRQVGDFALAEDAVQDAFEAALASWRREGVPARPGAWLTVAARRKAIDRLRRARAGEARAERLAELIRLDQAAAEELAMEEPTVIEDDRLQLIFTCCHPALGVEAREALTLRALGGLTAAEIARAFLVAEPAMRKRLVRAKAKIAAAGIPYRVPPDEELPERLRGVLRVLYLIFNEGYVRTGDEGLVRPDLCAEAIRLATLLAELMPDEAETWGLLALMLLHDARSAARTDAAGRFVALGDQDRARWDEAELARGRRALARAIRLGPPGPYALQAAITALHVEAPDPEETDWTQIAALYARLAELDPSPVVAVNRAAAVGFAAGPEQGLVLLEPLLHDPKLRRYPPLHATHADLLRRRGDAEGSAAAYERAAELSANAVERDELLRRRTQLLC